MNHESSALLQEIFMNPANTMRSPIGSDEASTCIPGACSGKCSGRFKDEVGGEQEQISA